MENLDQMTEKVTLRDLKKAGLCGEMHFRKRKWQVRKLQGVGWVQPVQEMLAAGVAGAE